MSSHPEASPPPPWFGVALLGFCLLLSCPSLELLSLFHHFFTSSSLSPCPFLEAPAAFSSPPPIRRNSPALLGSLSALPRSGTDLIPQGHNSFASLLSPEWAHCEGREGICFCLWAQHDAGAPPICPGELLGVHCPWDCTHTPSSPPG